MLLTQSLRRADDRAPTRILVVDDDHDATELLQRVLASDGFDVTTAETRPRAREVAADFHPDVIILDRTLNGEDSYDLLVELRRLRDFPVILVSTDDLESDKVVGLRMGADDYVVKPYPHAELVARIQAVIRRSRPRPTPTRHVYGRLELDTRSREVRVDGVPVDMTAKEFDLLAFLAASPRQAFTRDQLLQRVWASSSDWQDPATVTEHVRRVRTKLVQASGHDGWITTLRGVGYRFEPPAALSA